MRFKLSELSRFIYGMIFFGVCLWGSIATPNMLGLKKTEENLQDKVFLNFIQNDTEECEFQTFYGSESSSSLVFPQTIFNFMNNEALDLTVGNILVIKCCKGSFFPVFIKHSGIASGQAPENFEGPFCLSMWLSNPQVPETSKVHVRYIKKKGVSGKVGIKIGVKGDYRFVADENIQFLN